MFMVRVAILESRLFMGHFCHISAEVVTEFCLSCNVVLSFMRTHGKRSHCLVAVELHGMCNSAGNSSLLLPTPPIIT